MIDYEGERHNITINHWYTYWYVLYKNSESRAFAITSSRAHRISDVVVCCVKSLGNELQAHLFRSWSNTFKHVQTATTRHVMVGITRSKVICSTECIVFAPALCFDALTGFDRFIFKLRQFQVMARQEGGESCQKVPSTELVQNLTAVHAKSAHLQVHSIHTRLWTQRL